jgi:membrane protease YdiL (CAAX protease family)
VSGLALVVWGTWIATDLSRFTETLPEVSLLWIIINGIGFALLNALAEEYLARGMLWNGLEKIFGNAGVIIVLQSVIFSIFHFVRIKIIGLGRIKFAESGPGPDIPGLAQQGKNRGKDR